MIPYKSESNADLEFQFPDDILFEELDKQGVKLPKMKLVDFFIVREKDVLLVEVKDPSNRNVPEEEKARYLERLKNNELIANELTPKARDSYTFLHLMKRDNKPFKYIVILGIDAYQHDEQLAILGTFKDRLLNSIRNESFEPWKRKHIEDCFVMSVETWNKRFPEWKISRLSAGNR